MKILFYSPYLGSTFGGGEKYLLDCARLAAEKHQVFVLVHRPKQALATSKKQYQKFLGADLGQVNFITGPLGSRSSALRKLWWTQKFDCLYYETDGSFFFSLAKKNIAHIQVPLRRQLSLFDRLKLKNWQTITTNSYFTREVVEKSWGISVDLVHQPMVPLQPQPSATQLAKKQKMIVHVGRFFSHLHSKRQDTLVKVFAQLLQQYPKISASWHLILIGSIEDAAYAKKVQHLAKGLPVRILHQVNREELSNYYKKASIYWHATGYDVDEREQPEKVEHFGISTLEAMSYAAVPVVINKGGQKEILTGDLQTLLWNSEAECIEKTITVMQTKKQREKLALAAWQRSTDFSEAVFRQKLFTLLEG